MRGADVTLREEITSALARLTGTQHMGALFKVMAIGRSDAPPPPGF